MTADLLEQTLSQLVLFQQMAEVQDKDCRTSARSESAASQTTHRVAGPGLPWDRTGGCVLRAVPTGSDRPCAQGISPAGPCASCSRIPSRQMLAGPSCLHPKHLCFVYGILLCHNTPDLFRVSLVYFVGGPFRAIHSLELFG